MSQAPCCSGHATSEQKPVESQPSSAPQSGETLRLRIEEMCCPTEETVLRKALGSVSGVTALEFDLMGKVLSIHHHAADTDDIIRRITSTGMTPHPLDTQDEPSRETPTKRWGKLVIAGLMALAAELFDAFMPDTAGVGAVIIAPALALSAIVMVGLPTWHKGWLAIRHRTLNINALMSVAVTGALLIGHWTEAAMVMVLFTLAERIEAHSLERARNAIRDLLGTAPTQARRQTAAGTWEDVDASEVKIGELVRVRAGERLALDGDIVRGQTTLNEAPITGESLPRDKGPGDPVFAGTLNQLGEMDYRATRQANDTTLARIIYSVEQAQASRAPTQRFIDRFAAIYTPLVFGIAVLTALAWPLLFTSSWVEGVYRALVLLVIACPCALVISTPVSVVSGLSAAARAGILIKGGRFLEQGHRLKWLALDKTGTLTRGEPVLNNWVALGTISDAQRVAIAQQAIALAGGSNHPVSLSIHQALSSASDNQSTLSALQPQESQEHPGMGISARINGETLWLGNRRLREAQCASADMSQVQAHIDSMQHNGASVVMLGNAHQVLALFAVRDPLRQTSVAAITALHQQGVKTLMLSGDNSNAVAAIAKEAGIDEARGELLPEDKLRAIKEHSHQGVTGMVGDGINDAPALASADIGFAMGVAGSDVAIETADVALMDDDLRKLPTFIRFSRATRQVLIQNIVFALGIKAVFMGLAFAGMATLWMAVFADMGASLLVVANGLRLLRLTHK
ncbi:heavy metal translocating P-type ATPase [Halomonas halocynthiae]|uniref:heavy metal translocating P-type ATPase n=1 Tax=Halomonas halocynthiae TaxID=176290 RepID=UPI0009FF781B|nr:cation-translocating P-type ATPase [Halomonas halocynthiae]